MTTLRKMDVLANKLVGHDDVERVLISRIFAGRVDGYTVEMADEIVRAVLTALRTPSEEMVEAAFEAWTGDNWYATDEIKAAERAKLGPAFTAAIDVLLTPKDPEQ